MVVVKQDSELMTNYVAANPVPAGERFAVFTDDRQSPAVFALSENKILELIIVINGTSTKLDFGSTCGAFDANAQVQAFAVTQGDDGTLDISVAVPGNGGLSNYFLFHGVEPKELQGRISSSKIIRGTQFPPVKHIFQQNKRIGDKSGLPMVMVSFKNLHTSVSTEDLSYVLFDGSTASLSKWDMATQPKKVIDVALGGTANGDGALILYEDSKGEQTGPAEMFLQYKYFSGRSKGFTVEPQCPAGATCLSSYLHPDSGQSIMLVGGKEVTKYTALQYTSSKKRGTIINTPDHIGGLKDLNVSQYGEELRLWYTTDADAVHYYTTTTRNPAKGTVIPLLAEKEGGRVSSMLKARSEIDKNDKELVSSLISVDETGNLTLLQQDSATQIWQQCPFWYASQKDIMELRGYLLRMHAIAEDNDDKTTAIPGCYLRVSSSGVARCIINGRDATVSPTPQWFQTDTKGVLNIMLQNDDATCNEFCADAWRTHEAGSPETPLREIRILNPARKNVKKLEGVKTAADLRALQAPDGTYMVDGNISVEDANNGATCISTLVDQVHKFYEDERQKMAQEHHERLWSSFRAGEPLPTGIFFTWKDLGDAVSGAWHWVQRKFKEVGKWGVKFVEDTAGKVWKFVVHLAGEVIELALDTISAIVNAITWVFKKLGAFFQKIFDFFKFLFGWHDILDTADSLATMFNASLDYGQELVQSTEVNIDSWLEHLRSTIKSQLSNLQSYNYSDATASAASQGEETGSEMVSLPAAIDAEDPHDETQSGVAYNWSTYYFTYGGGYSNAVIDDGENADEFCSATSADQKIVEIWNKIQGELESIATTSSKVFKDVVDFFVSGGRDIKGLMGKISVDLVDEMIDSLKKFSEILFETLSVGIGLTQSMANKAIHIPVLGSLWEKVIAKGRGPLTLLYLISLMIAIPTTVLYKATLKVAPPKLKGRVSASAFKKYVNGEGDGSIARDIQNFVLSAGSSLEMVYGEFETLALLADGTFEGTGLESSPIGPIAQVMGVVNSAALIFDTIDGFFGWPVGKPDGSSSVSIDNETVGQVAKYSKWGLKLVKLGSSVVVLIVSKAKAAEQPAVKRWKGTIAAVISVPMLCAALTMDINSAVEAKKKPGLIVDAFIEAFLSFGKQWGYAVACWNNEVENDVQYVGLAVKQACTYARYTLKVVDFVEGHI